MTGNGDPDFQVFRISADKNQKSGLTLAVKSNIQYSIGFSISEANAVLRFSLTTQGREDAKNVTGYEVNFTNEFLSEEISMLSEKLGLFKSDLPGMFLISPQQECRVKEIFESMIYESAGTDVHKKEMQQILIHELILLSRRLSRIG